MHTTIPARFANLLFYTGLLLLVLIFLWTRFDSSDHLYYVGDGTFIVAMIEEMLASGDWTADAGRILPAFNLQEEWQGFVETPVAGQHYFNLSGYVVVATAFCRGLQMLGLEGFSIPFMLHGFNVLLQGLTLWLLFLMGRQMAGRGLGLLNMLFFIFLPLAVAEAHYERPEAWLAFLSSLMLFAALRHGQTPVRSAFMLGIGFGLSVSVKFSQLFLGIIPFALLCHLFWQLPTDSWRVRSRRALFHGAIMAIGAAIAMVINVPFILQHLPDYFREVAGISQFFDAPHPLYATGEYHYLSQLMYMGNYFHATLGAAWCLVLLSGFYLCLFPPAFGVHMPLYYRLSLVIPPAFILFYFALKYNFMERIFSATEPMLCMLSAVAIYTLKEFIQRTSLHIRLQGLLLLAVLALVLVKPAKLDYVFVQHYIRQPGYTQRIDFQEKLKKDFHGFWIKNIHVTAGFTSAIPEKPGKAPRIYHLEDYNQYWSAIHREKLQQNGFILIGTYCSDFAELPQSNHTIYHAAAKNHYWVRQDEWPASVAPGYFKTNCP